MRRCLLLLTMALICGLAGCGRESNPKVFRVIGRLTVAGEPAANANLAFHPVNRQDSRVFCPVALTRDDGSYELTTYAAGDGAPPGEYVVTVIWRDPTQPFDECECPDLKKHDLFQGQYADPRTSQLHATVRPERNDIAFQATMASDPN